MVTEPMYPKIKICGLTDPEEAKVCAKLGADAIGLVFFPASPRHVSMDQATALTAALPDHVAAVGVFVNPDLKFLRQTVDQCGLDIVQLHGDESPDFISSFKRTTNARIIKALFTQKAPMIAEAGGYDVEGFLVECGKGQLPGGNAMTWNWGIAKEFARHYPLALAGGLAPNNVTQAISDCLPDAVDASSSLEVIPGRKDLKKVEQFIDQVRQTGPLYKSQKRRIRSFLFSSD